MDLDLLPDIKRDGYHGVEDDDVGPEGEEAGENGVPLNGVPGQVYLEVHSNQTLPNGVSNGQNSSHTDKEGKDLGYRSIFLLHTNEKMMFVLLLRVLLLLLFIIVLSFMTPGVWFVLFAQLSKSLKSSLLSVLTYEHTNITVGFEPVPTNSISNI